MVAHVERRTISEKEEEQASGGLKKSFRFEHLENGLRVVEVCAPCISQIM
jgi:hypothetical protein